MHIYIFNLSLLVGWVMVLVGGMLVSPAFGLVGGGLLLLVLVFISLRVAGGVYAPGKQGEGA